MSIKEREAERSKNIAAIAGAYDADCGKVPNSNGLKYHDVYMVAHNQRLWLNSQRSSK